MAQMKDIIFLVADRHKVLRMTKNLPDLNRGEIPIKLNITVNPDAYGEPVIAQDIVIDDWTNGVKFDDVEFSSNIITKAEADKIKKMRLDKMAEILASNGFEVSPKQENENDLP